jgi:SagB-type dehydrogenase family enzyme
MGQDIVVPKFDRLFLFEELLNRRDSIRQFSGEKIAIEQLSRILWAAYGNKGRVVPSAGAVYPLRIYVIMRDKVYRYKETILEFIQKTDLNYYNAPLIVLVAANYTRMVQRYGKRAYRYIWIEVGQVLQNITIATMHLQLGSVVVGGFRDGKIKRLLGIPDDPICLICVGRKEE